MVTQTMPTIDVHAHILTEETIRLLQSEAPKVGPKLSDIGDQFATLDVAGNVYRQFPRGGWDLERRLQDMAAAKVDAQVLSVCPQTFLYGQPAPLAAALARIPNEELAKLAQARPDRVLAIATLPNQAPEQTADQPTQSVKRFYFDTIVHSKEVLAFLVGNAGAERVLLGSDYPFDMGMPHGVSQVRSLSISATDQAAILGGRARALLDKVSARAFA